MLQREYLVDIWATDRKYRPNIAAQISPPFLHQDEIHLLTTPNNLPNSNLARYLEPRRPGTELSYSLIYSFVESYLEFCTTFAIAYSISPYCSF